ncbi:MAG: S8 family peptidase [Acidimicrobiales bacterium]
MTPRLGRGRRAATAVAAVGAALAVLGVLAAADTAQAQAQPAPTAPAQAQPADGQLVVTVDAGRRPSEAALSRAAGVAVRYARADGDEGYVLRAAGGASGEVLREAARRLEGSGLVRSAGADEVVHPALAPDDPYYAQQWALRRGPGNLGLDLPAAWELTSGSPAVVIAVLDTGVAPHAELAGRLLPGYDFVRDLGRAGDGNGADPDAADPGDYCANAALPSSWHGLHVAGIIAARAGNGQGVAGVDWGARILPVRVLGRCGGLSSDVADGIRWAAGVPVPGIPPNPHPATVINLSLGRVGPCLDYTQQAIDAAVAAGATVVVAAGNDGVPAATFQPANCTNVITVAAANQHGGRAWFSNYGDGVDLAAPGVGILSLGNDGAASPGADGYAWKSGTSMAAPFTAGVVGLVKARRPDLSPAAVRALLRSSARAFPDGACESVCGAGLLDAAAAVSALGPGTVSVDTPDGGESPLRRRTQWTIRWRTSPEAAGPVRLELLRNGRPTALIARAAAAGPDGEGSVTWRAPALLRPGDSYRVRVRSAAGLSAVSPASFTVR